MVTRRGMTNIAVAAALVACGDPPRDPTGVAPSFHRDGDGGGGAEWSPWSEPVNLGATVNTPSGDQNPGLSPNELQLYFISNRPGGLGGNDIWVSQRRCPRCPWETPVNLGAPINSDAAEAAPTLSYDGRLLFFSSQRPGGFGGGEIYVSHLVDGDEDDDDGDDGRDQGDDERGWGPPVNLGPDVNTAAPESGVYYALNRGSRTATLYFNRGPAGSSRDLYSVSLNRNGQPLGPALPVSELNYPTADDQKLTVRADGRELLFSSDRPGSLGGFDLWVSTRRSAGDTWSTPSHLEGPLNTTSGDSQPSLSHDGRTLIFNSDRPGGSGGNDLWMSTRRRIGQRER
jgi:WD40 repeat protein